jgi:hypothetical protein
MVVGPEHMLHCNIGLLMVNHVTQYYPFYNGSLITDNTEPKAFCSSCS